LTAVIGTGAFTDFGRASATIGPGGALLVIGIVGIIAALFMEALSEMLQIFRTVNPLVEYVQVFVDPALAKCVAAVYWFSYASFMADQLMTAASYLEENLVIGETISIFYITVPLMLLALNMLPVEVSVHNDPAMKNSESFYRFTRGWRQFSELPSSCWFWLCQWY